MHRVSVAFLLFLAASSPAATNADPAGWLERNGRPPVDYVLSSFNNHRVVILGEAHWIRHDAELVAAAIPRLPSKGVRFVGVEVFPSTEQARIDRLVNAETWVESEAVAVLRAAAWPYRQYAEILRAAWRTNREAPGSIRVIGLGPPADHREKKIDYDAFLAGRVLDEIGRDGRALVYVGLHHAFTRYHQPAVLDNGRADEFMDRAGNMLARRLGEEVFLIVLHRPFWCGSPVSWSYCLPADGAIDCAAAGAGRPVGFDLVGSPFAAIEMDHSVYYAHGYPSVRLIDFADGWIWFATIDRYRGAELIPLTEFAPDAATRDQVRKHNPFSNKRDLTDAEIEALWAQQAKQMDDTLAMRRWNDLPAAMERCER